MSHVNGFRNRFAAGADGQAMVEFVVGLMALLIVAAAVLTIGLLTNADTAAYNEAQSEAIDGSMGAGFTASFSPRKDNDAGADRRYLTADDEPVTGSLGPMRQHLAAEGDAAGRPVRPDGAPLRHDALFTFADGTGGDEGFGFRKGEASRSVPIAPAARRFFGLRETAEVRNEVWMPQTGGLY